MENSNTFNTEYFMREFISVVLKSDSRPHLYDNMTNIISKIVK